MKAGDRIFSYIVERELGEGGMGTVFLGRHTVLNQQVAIKALSPLLSRDQALRERFIQEANIQAGLRHPGIVQVLTAEMEGEQPSLVMEYIDGKSLAEVLELRGALPVDDAVKIMEQVLSAVGYAHRQGVIHRDLKPSNVMVMASGEAKVTDFGIAKVLGSSKLTRTGTAMGSAHYMSPEQIRRPETVDARSDIYSLGCVFYEVLTGRPPFGEKDASGTESDYEVKTAHVSEPVVAPRTLNEDIPPWLEQLVMQLLNKEPEQRLYSCEAILALLRQGSESKPDAVIFPAPDPEIRTNKNWSYKFFAVAILLIACAGIFFLSKEKEASFSSKLSDSNQTTAQVIDEVASEKTPREQIITDIRTLDGDWYSDKWAYGYTLENGKGYATVTNSTNFEVGQEIVRLSAVGNNRFSGQNVYKDGKFYEVTVTLQTDGSLSFDGEKNARWSMKRISKTQLDLIKQRINADNPPPPAKTEVSSGNNADLSRLNGDWYSKKWAYGYTLNDGKGYATITNSPNFDVGQEIVRLSAIGENQFIGHNVYKDGKFYKVKVTLRPDGSLFFEGEKNATWSMERITKTELNQLRQRSTTTADHREQISLLESGNRNNLTECPRNKNASYDNCWGTHTFADGDKYVGEFKDNTYNGQGTYTFASGGRYIGEFQNGNFHGKGTYISANGDRREGIWKNHIFQGN